MSKIDDLLKELYGEMQVLSENEKKGFVGGGTESESSPSQIPSSGTMYAVFDKSDSLFTMYWDGGTPDDSSDDVMLFSGSAHNNTTSSSNGPWPNGEYTMLDQHSGHMHPGSGNADTASGAYGTSGIYRAEPFEDGDSGITRTGMGVHSGRENKEFPDRLTNGCIRVEQDTMDSIDEHTNNGWTWNKIIVQD